MVQRDIQHEVSAKFRTACSISTISQAETSVVILGCLSRRLIMLTRRGHAPDPIRYPSGLCTRDVCILCTNRLGNCLTCCEVRRRTPTGDEMSDRLPNTREMPRLVSQSVLLGSVGSALRAQYDELRSEPIPEHLLALIQKLSEQDQTSSLTRGR